MQFVPKVELKSGFRRSQSLWLVSYTFARSMHRDQRGAMSLVSVFALLLLTMVLGQVMNSAREVDHKVKMQNAADAATWTGGLVMVRSLNSLAFTNHLLCD